MLEILNKNTIFLSAIWTLVSIYGSQAGASSIALGYQYRSRISV